MTEFSSWDEYWDDKRIVETNRGAFNVYSSMNDSNYVIYFAHGAGHSGLSFSLLANNLRKHYSVIAPDLKCHGDTVGNPATDLSIDGLVEDFVSISSAVIPLDKKVILVGHSLGGTIATFASSKIPCFALIVIDTIEGLSIQQMPQMRNILAARPQSFKSAADVISYISTSGEMQNPESASISSAGRVKLCEDGTYKWRTDLLKCENDWNGWFIGFAEAYLKSPVYKVLVLPTIDRLDTPFTIAHMSGKFQLSVVIETNHCIHEDAPNKVAEIITKLIKRIGDSPNWK